MAEYSHLNTLNNIHATSPEVKTSEGLIKVMPILYNESTIICSIYTRSVLYSTSMNLILKSEPASLCEKVTKIQTSDRAVVICRAPNSDPLVGSHLIECSASFKNEVSAGTQVNALFLVRLPCGDSCHTRSAMKTKWRLELVYLTETNEWMISLRENFGWLVYTQTVILMYKNYILNPQTNEEMIVYTPVLAINLKALKATTLAQWLDRRVRVTRSNQADLDVYVDALGTVSRFC
ncbi:uncharacterized protein DEA37_0004531 [Paragonimus westermani]|uniref:Uncharacterized protein n=1 Tax=Paragonimus westermani TaxID=34504 RepID=A0A5J4P153_9TREM|nr:uncharacterized protein DEA37_0004531 [Paragonimus westermani]